MYILRKVISCRRLRIIWSISIGVLALTKYTQRLLRWRICWRFFLPSQTHLNSSYSAGGPASNLHAINRMRRSLIFHLMLTEALMDLKIDFRLPESGIDCPENMRSRHWDYKESSCKPIMTMNTTNWGVVIFSISLWAKTVINRAVKKLIKIIPTGK